MEDYQALKGYLNDEGKFERMPGKKQKKKLALMLQFLAEKFETERKYSEKQVNEILNEHHSFKDPATLRRLLFTNHLIDRTLDGRSYWLVGKGKQSL